jgi:hypothetical protein
MTSAATLADNHRLAGWIARGCVSSRGADGDYGVGIREMDCLDGSTTPWQRTGMEQDLPSRWASRSTVDGRLTG